jgi:hypothetical protein
MLGEIVDVLRLLFQVFHEEIRHPATDKKAQSPLSHWVFIETS